MPYVKFLGTGGARFVVAKQLRSSAGVLVESNERKLLIDPGPGTLARLANSRPKVNLDTVSGIILTHIHLDHSTDANVIIDSIAEGGFKRKGVLFTTHEAVEGENRVILPYLLPFLERYDFLEHKKTFEEGDICFTTYRHLHSVETYGIKMDLSGKMVSFLVDTQYFDSLLEYYKGSDILILNVVLLESRQNIMHLSVDDAKRLINGIKPGKAILTHFGMGILKANPLLVSQKLSQETGVEVVAAYDGMKVEI